MSLFLESATSAPRHKFVTQQRLTLTLKVNYNISSFILLPSVVYKFLVCLHVELKKRLYTSISSSFSKIHYSAGSLTVIVSTG